MDAGGRVGRLSPRAFGFSGFLFTMSKNLTGHKGRDARRLARPSVQAFTLISVFVFKYRVRKNAF